jgi:hypothetical protein
MQKWLRVLEFELEEIWPNSHLVQELQENNEIKLKLTPKQHFLLLQANWKENIINLVNFQKLIDLSLLQTTFYLNKEIDS